MGWQKAVSLVCSIILLAPLLVKVSPVNAAEQLSQQKLVVIVVAKNLFSGDVDDKNTITGKINRYAQDVQNTLPQTKSLILPIPQNANAGELFRILEKLYIEGQKRGNHIFRLSGVVFIGNTPIPLIRTYGQDIPSFFPLTDFEDPAFLWDAEQNVFVENSDNGLLQAEIFHGVIRAPETSDKTESEWLTNFFDKNHAYHTGKKEKAPQKLLVADFIAEAKSIQSQKEKMYEIGENELAADLAFYRYNNTLLSDVEDLNSQSQAQTIDFSLGEDVENENLRHSIQEWQKNWEAEKKQGSFSKILEESGISPPDNITYQQINQLIPSYPQVTDKYMGEINQIIKKSGRWEIEKQTADTIPGLIQQMDMLSREFIREFSTKFEEEITHFVDEKWQKPIPVLDSIFANEIDYDVGPEGNPTEKLEPYFHGKPISDISHVEECSLFRGSLPHEKTLGESSQLVELNHLYNKNSDDDSEILQNECKEYGKCCVRYMNTPQECKPEKAIRDVFDLKGGKLVTEGKEPSFEECLHPTFPERNLRSNIDFFPFAYEGTHWEVDRRQPYIGTGEEEGRQPTWNETIVGRFIPAAKYAVQPYTILKRIPSTFVHNEPRPETISGIISNVVSGAIPADDIRRVTFQDNGNLFRTVDFPDMFAFKNVPVEASDEEIQQFVVEKLQKKEDEIRGEIQKSNIESYREYISARRYGLMRDGSRIIPNETVETLLLSHEYLRTLIQPIIETKYPRTQITRENILSILDKISEKLYVQIQEKVEQEKPQKKAEKAVENILQTAFPNATTSNERWAEYAKNPSSQLDAKIGEAIIDAYDFEGDFFLRMSGNNGFPLFYDTEKKNIPSLLEFSQKGGETLLKSSPQKYILYKSEDSKNTQYDYTYFDITKKTEIPFPYSHLKNPFIIQDEEDRDPLEGQTAQEVSFSVVSLPQKGFLTGEHGEKIKERGGIPLAEFIRWRALTTDEKHKRIMQLYASGALANVLGESAKKEYEFSIIRAHGNKKEFWWKREPGQYLPGDDVQWDKEKDTQKPSEKKDAEKDTGYKNEKCYSGGNRGVPVTKWLSAFECWMEETLDTPVNIEMSNQCSFTPVLDISGSDDYPSFDDILSDENANVPDGSYIEISSNTGGNVPVGQESVVTINFINPDGEKITGGISFDIFAENGAKMHIGNEKTESTYQTVYSGSFSFPIQVENDNATLTVVAKNFPKKTYHFSAIENGKVELEELPSDTLSQKRISIRLIGDSEETLTSFTGQATGMLNNEFLAKLPEKSVPITNGVGEILVNMLGSAPLTLSVTVPGFAPRKIVVEGNENAFVGEKLFIKNLPKAIGKNEEYVVDIQVMDANGKTQSAPQDTQFYVTDATKHLAEIDHIEGSTFFIRGKNITGTARIVASYPGLISDTRTVFVVEKFADDITSSLPTKSTLTALLGSDFGNIAASPNAIANRLLFTGDQQSVISSLFSSSGYLPAVSVQKNGAISVFEENIAAQLVHTTPLTIQLFDTNTQKEKAVYSISFGADATEETKKEKKKESGIFFTSLDTSGVLTSKKTSDGLHIFFGDQDILHIDAQTGVEILDNRFTLVPQTNTNELTLSLLFENTNRIAEIFIKNPNISLVQAAPDALELFSVAGNNDGSSGFSVIGTRTGNILSGKGKEATDNDSIFGVGFNENDNFALQIASGVPVGEATKYSFGPSSILLGDPTISLPTDKVLVDGFDTGIGKEIHRKSIVRNDFVRDFRNNNDALPEILSASKNGDIRIFENIGDMEFIEKGSIFQTDETLQNILTADFNQDNKDDLLVFSDEGKLFVYENTRTSFRKRNDLQMPEADFESVQVRDFDLDGFPDLLGYEKNGDISVFWGNKNGYSSNAKTRLEGFGARVDESNLALDNTMISVPGLIAQTQNIYALNIGVTGSDALGIETALTLSDDENAKKEYTPVEGGDILGTLEKLQETYSDSFSQNFSGNTGELALQHIGIFTPLNTFPNVVVELFAHDINGGIVQKGDEVQFTLRVKNQSSDILHFSLAHMIHTALQMEENSFHASTEYLKSGREMPILEDHGEEGIRIINILLDAGEQEEFSFTAKMLEESAVTPLIRDDLDFPDYPADGKPDISLLLSGIDGVVDYLSGENRTFTRYFDANENPELPEYLQKITTDKEICDIEGKTPEELETDSDGDGIPNAEDGNNGCIPDYMKKDEDNDGTSDFLQNAQNPYTQDSDGDGIPDGWDYSIGNFDATGGTWGEIVKNIGEMNTGLKEFSKCDGGCLDIPINFAFLVPGKVNTFPALVGALQGILGKTVSGGGGISNAGEFGFEVTMSEEVKNFAPAFVENTVKALGKKMQNAVTAIGETGLDVVSTLGGGELVKKVREGGGDLDNIYVPDWAGIPVFGTLNSFPFVCTGQACNNTLSQFRIYLSPTLTGALATAICVGAWQPGHSGKGAKCMVFAPSSMNLGVCNTAEKQPKNKYSGASDSKNGCSLVNATPQKATVKNTDSGGFKGLLFNLESLGSFKVSYNTGGNRRVPNFPGSWLYKQMAEFHAMLTTLPSITVYLPDFSGVIKEGKMDSIFGKIGDVHVGDSVKTVLNGTDGEGAIQGAKDSTAQVVNGIQKAMGELPLLFSPSTPTNKNEDTANQKQTSAFYKEKAEEYLAKTKKMQKNTRQVSGDISELYDAISSLPLLKIREVNVPIKVPYLSRAQIFALRSDISSWIADAEAEVKRATDDWAAGCQDGKEACDEVQAVKEKIIVNANKTIATAKKNLNILESYIRQPAVLANIDMLTAQWLSQVICTIDTSVLYVSEWYVRNKKRIRAWEDLVDALREIRQSWSLVGEVLGNFENYCPSCRANRGESVNNVFQLGFGFLPDIPIIRFPRLPDIVLDLSRWKGGIVIPMPNLNVQLVQIKFPKIPRLALMGAPLWEIQLPAIPLLPDLSFTPKLPPFPAVPKITLPNLPPFPRLPDFPKNIFNFLQALRPLLVVFCMFSEGNLPIDEKTQLKSVIEGLTSRSSKRILSFDLAGALLPDIVIPSVRRIEIALELNLDFAAGESLIDATKKIFKPWNEVATDTRNQIENLRRKMWLDIQEAGGGAHFDTIPKKYKVEKLFGKTTPQTSIFDIFEKHFAILRAQALDENQKTYTPTELLHKMGKQGVMLPEKLPAVEKMENLRSSIVALQKKYINEAKVLAKHKDITRIQGSFVADSTLAAQTFPHPITLDLPQKERKSLEKKEPLLTNDVASLFTTMQTNATHTYATSEKSILSTNGLYSECNGKSTKVIANDNFVENMNTIFVADFDGDGDDDMLLANRTSIFIKENHTKQDTKKYLSSPPEIANFSAFLPTHEGVKNVFVRGNIEKMRTGFLADFSTDLLGVDIEISNNKNSFFDEESKNKSTNYSILLLASRYISAENNPKTFTMDTDVFVEQNHFIGNILVAELTGDSIRVALPAGNWFLQAKEIRVNGLSNGSEIHHFLVQKEPKTETETQKGDVQTLFLNSLSSESSPEKNILKKKNIPYTITVRNTDSRGNFTEDGSTRVVKGPDIHIDENALKKGEVHVYTKPRIAGVPFSLFRERLGVQTRITTKSSNAKKQYETDVYGEQIISDFSEKKGALLTNRQGKVLARIEENKIYLTSDNVTVVASNSGKIGIIYQQTGRVLAEIVPVSDGNTDVFITEGEITVGEADQFLRGTYVSDRNKNDIFSVEHIPSSAPTFPGGAALMKNGEIIGMISAKGELQMLQENFSFRVKNTNISDGYIILTLLDESGRERFDIFSKTGEQRLVLFKNNEEVRKYFEPKTFSLLKETEEKKVPPPTEKITGIDMAFLAQSLYSCKECIPLLPSFSFVTNEKKMCVQTKKYDIDRALFSLLEKKKTTLDTPLSVGEVYKILHAAFPNISPFLLTKTDILQELSEQEKSLCPPSFPSFSLDLCPTLPEDEDGIDDTDGCPEYDFSEVFSEVAEGMYITAGYSEGNVTTLDYIADIRPGDRVFAAIESEDGNTIYRTSKAYEVPKSFEKNQ